VADPAAAGDAIAARSPYDPVRHPFISKWPFLTLCHRCSRIKEARVHRLGSRCSMCFRYYRRYELDDSRRCDECRP
jgi:hypothetical protein